uniref:Amino acid transporter n=1 Tax=Ascaris lumbricoides TaxID=6252 RepID=A0A0M3I5J6_ASCLU
MPTLAAMIALFLNIPTQEEIATYARMATFINALNMVIIIISRQGDILVEVLKLFRFRVSSRSKPKAFTVPVR